MKKLDCKENIFYFLSMNANESILYPERYYHIYNHGNSDDNIFLNDDNYSYFLKRYMYFINPIIDTFAYCLMPNHFHFVIQVKTEKEILLYHNVSEKDKQMISKSMSVYLSQQFSNLFNSYSKAFNKMHNRSGKLFRLPFKRKLLDTDLYLQKAIHYVHANPVHHGFVKDMRDWKYSSIHAYESSRKTNIKKEAGLILFNGIDGFKYFHSQPVDEKYKLEMDFS